MTIISTNDAPAAEISHPAHPEHKLKKVVATGDAKGLFKCDGCKEDGAGVWYRCEPCNFDLHMCCAKLAGATLVHPLLESCEFKFLYETSKNDARLCDACSGKVLGFNYQCGNLNLHPCCAELPLLIPQEELTFELRKEASHKCSSCGGRGGYGTFWFYRSKCKNVYLHVRCVKEVFLKKQGISHAAAAGSSSSSSGSTASAAAAGDDTRVINFVKERALEKYGKKKAGESFERICRMAATVVRIIIGVLIGDPTPIIAAVVVGLFSG